MSIEVILIPLAIGLTSNIINECLSGKTDKDTIEKELQKGSEYNSKDAFFTTKITDNNILRNILGKLNYKKLNYGDNNSIEIDFEDFSVIFEKNESEIFKAVFNGNIDQNKAQKSPHRCRERAGNLFGRPPGDDAARYVHH